MPSPAGSKTTRTWSAILYTETDLFGWAELFLVNKPSSSTKFRRRDARRPFLVKAKPALVLLNQTSAIKLYLRRFKGRARLQRNSYPSKQIRSEAKAVAQMAARVNLRFLPRARR